MLNLNIENILPNLFNISKEENKDISLISILTIKSLVPDTKNKGNRIDYKRFNEELKLWKHYRVGDNPSLLNILDKIDKDIYLNSEDEIIYSRIIPIILANERYEIIEDEIIKNILFVSGNIGILLEWLLVGKFLYLILNKEEEIIDKLKDYIINISQIDFLKNYKDFYRIKLEENSKSYKVEFERKRLDLINILNGINIKKYKYTEDLLNILKSSKVDTILGNIIYNSLYNETSEDISKGFYNNMNEYILKLRKGRINPDNLVIEDYKLPNIFNYEEGEVFYHSLLNNSKVIKKEVKDGVLTSLIKSRSGMYLFTETPV